MNRPASTGAAAHYNRATAAAAKALRSLTHDYSDDCVCVGCQGVRAERRHAKQTAEREGQAAAHKVTRYGYGLIEAKNKDRNVLISRAGVAYEREASGAVRRIGSARIIGKNAIQVHPHEHVRGKAARKTQKRARQAERQRKLTSERHAVALDSSSPRHSQPSPSGVSQ